MWEPTRLLYGEGRRPWRHEGITPHDATRSRGPTGVMAVACLHTEIRRNTGSLGGGGAGPPTDNPRGPGRGGRGGGGARTRGEAGGSRRGKRGPGQGERHK